MDANQVVQGPFPEAKLCEWFVAGHLPADLLVRATNQPGETFSPLSNQVGVGGALLAACRLPSPFEVRAPLAWGRWLPGPQAARARWSSEATR